MLLLATALSGCEDYQPKPVVPDDLVWEKAPEDSRFAIIHRPVGTEGKTFDYAFRCWNRDGEYRCIELGDVAGTGIKLSYFRTKSLPKTLSSSPDGDEKYGYDCTWATDGPTFWQEGISNRHGELVSNSSVGGLGGPRWSQLYVNDYIRQNNIGSAAPWFDCLGIMEAISTASMASVGSTSVSYAQVAPVFEHK